MNLNKIEYIYSDILDKIHFGKVLSEKEKKLWFWFNSSLKNNIRNVSNDYKGIVEEVLNPPLIRFGKYQFENPNDTQYCLKFKDGTGTDLQPTSNASIYYIAGGLAVLGLAYYYRKELMKLF